MASTDASDSIAGIPEPAAVAIARRRAPNRGSWGWFEDWNDGSRGVFCWFDSQSAGDLALAEYESWYMGEDGAGDGGEPYPVAWAGSFVSLLVGDQEFEEGLRWEFWHDECGVVLPYAGAFADGDAFLAWVRMQSWAKDVEDQWIGWHADITVRWVTGEDVDAFAVFLHRRFASA